MKLSIFLDNNCVVAENIYTHPMDGPWKFQGGGAQLLQGLLWFAEKTIEQTQQWTLALKTMKPRDTKVPLN